MNPTRVSRLASSLIWANLLLLVLLVALMVIDARRGPVLPDPESLCPSDTRYESHDYDADPPIVTCVREKSRAA